MAVTADISVSLDLVGAGDHQSRDHLFGDATELPERMGRWMWEHAEDNAPEVAAITAAGAFIMGRNMFGPDRGDWDLDWRGWRGDDPPYHAPVFVLASLPREPLVMEGGTTFFFVMDGVESALAQATQAASAPGTHDRANRDVSIAGGPSTTNAFLKAGLIDELRDGVPDLELAPVSSRTTPHVTHVTWRRLT